MNLQQAARPEQRTTMTVSNLTMRCLTAAVGIPAILALLMRGPRWAVAAVLIAISLLTAYELAQLLLPPADFSPQRGRVLPYPDWRPALWRPVLSLVLGLVLGSIALSFDTQIRTVVACCLAALVVGALWSGPETGVTATRAPAALAVVAYGGMPWVAVWNLYSVSKSAERLILVLAIVWSVDIACYAAGKTLGRHKLAPSISPGKTVEGAIGGLLAGTAASVLCGFMLPSLELAPAELCAIGLAASAAGQAGDLCKSLLKRNVGVKDSGRLVPGHGGMLDRLDSLLLAAPFVWLCLPPT